MHRSIEKTAGKTYNDDMRNRFRISRARRAARIIRAVLFLAAAAAAALPLNAASKVYTQEAALYSTDLSASLQEGVSGQFRTLGGASALVYGAGMSLHVGFDLNPSWALFMSADGAAGFEGLSLHRFVSIPNTMEFGAGGGIQWRSGRFILCLEAQMLAGLIMSEGLSEMKGAYMGFRATATPKITVSSRGAYGITIGIPVSAAFSGTLTSFSAGLGVGIDVSRYAGGLK